MFLPKKIVPYATALLSAPYRFNVVYLSYFVDRSHDFLTRSLQTKVYRWKTILVHFLWNKCLNLGYLIIDETDIDKSFAENIKGLSWVFSHRKNKHIFGYHIVAVVWTNGTITIPLGWKVYNKRNGKTKIDLALELIVYCTGALKIKPKAWLFDSLYASEKILKFLNRSDLLFYCQIPKNRLFNHQQLKYHNKGRPYWTECGYIKGKLYVQIVKNRRKYFLTNNIGITRKEQLGTYKIRWKIEEVFRFVKQELGFERCQCRSLTAQNNHFGVCFFLYATLQDTAENTQLTDYQLKTKAIRNELSFEDIVMSAFDDSA